MVSWQKILYKRQPYPDNYSGGEKQFLKELRKNVSVVSYRYLDVVMGVCNLICHIDCVVLFFILFEHVYNNNLSSTTLGSTYIVSVATLYTVYCFFLATDSLSVADHIYTCVSLISIGFGLTPAIRTLTDTISTDTVYALSFLSALVSCIFHDYGVCAPVVSRPLSVSSGLCSAIFLLSRLKNNTEAFFMLAISFVVHACSPEFRNTMFHRSPTLSSIITAMLASGTVWLLYSLYPELSILLLISHIFIIFICPLILVCKQSGKRNIHGPWDEAVPTKY